MLVIFRSDLNARRCLELLSLDESLGARPEILCNVFASVLERVRTLLAIERR